MKQRSAYNDACMPEEPHSTEDERAVRACTDEAAFTELYEHYLPRIFAYITRRMNDRDEAEDLVSLIFMRVVEKLPNFNPQKASFKTWIFTIATRMLIDYYRAHNRSRTEKIELAHDIPDGAKKPNEAAEGSMEREWVLDTIAQLSERHQRLLLLKFFGGFSVDELAEVFAVTPNNASVMANRALHAFRVKYQRNHA